MAPDEQVLAFAREHQDELLSCGTVREAALAALARIVTGAEHITPIGLVQVAFCLHELDEWEADPVQACADRDWTPAIGYQAVAAAQLERLNGDLDALLRELR